MAMIGAFGKCPDAKNTCGDDPGVGEMPWRKKHAHN
jgi:hypothetical protein